MRAFHTSGLVLAALLLLAIPALAKDITLLAPATAEQGTAIQITAVLNKPVPAVTFVWQGKSIKAPVVPARKHWEASILLPVPVNASKNMLVRAYAEKLKTDATIRVKKIAWPRQNISVNKNYVTPPGETLDRIAADRKKTAAVLSRISPERYWHGPFQRPVPGVVTSAFGGKRVFNGEVRSYHRGVDLRAPQGTPILALADGRVAIAENMYYSGNVVFIDHGLGAVSSYAHMSRLDVHPGDRVTAGQQIGLSGATGRVTGPHLHLGLNILGQAVDPLSLFPKQ